MHSYRSLMMVAAMAGVMVVMAGVLVNTEQMARQRSATPATAETWVPLGARGGDRTAPAFDRCLERIRLLAESKSRGAAAGELARQIDQASALADENALPSLQRLLAEPELESMLEDAALRLLGASGAPSAASLLAAHYEDCPLVVLESLETLGGPAAFEQVCHLHRAEDEPEPRRRLRRAALRIDPERAVEEVLALALASMPNADEASAVLDLLAESGVGAAVRVVTLFLVEKPEAATRVERSALDALVALWETGGENALEDLSRHTDLAPSRQLAAAAALTCRPAGPVEAR